MKSRLAAAAFAYLFGVIFYLCPLFHGGGYPPWPVALLAWPLLILMGLLALLSLLVAFVGPDRLQRFL